MTKKVIFISSILCVMVLTVTPPILKAVIINVPDDYPSIREAVTAAEDFDEIRIADGLYSGPDNRDIDIEKSLTIGSKNGPESCILDASNTSRFFTITGTVDVVFKGLTFQNGRVYGSYAIYGGAIYDNSFNETATVKIDACIFINNGLICNGHEHDTSRGGAVCGASLITNSVFHQNYADSSNYASGGAVQYCDSVVNCTFYDNQINSEYGAGSQIDYCQEVTNCIIFDPLTPSELQIQHCTEVSTCFFDDPAFRNLDPFDYHLTEFSSCIETGSPVDLDYDIDGQERPQYNQFDIGADEYYSSFWTPSPTPTVTAVPTCTNTPTPTMTPTSTPVPLPDYLMVMPDTDLEAGDMMDLSIYRFVYGDGYRVDEYVLLEVAGCFYFWPGWTTGVTGAFDKYLPSGESTEQILVFEWPNVSGVGHGLIFHAAIFSAGTTLLKGYDAVRWGYY